MTIALAAKFDDVSLLFAQLSDENSQETISKIANVLTEGKAESIIDKMRFEFDAVMQSLGWKANVEMVFLGMLERIKDQSGLASINDAFFEVILSETHGSAEDIMEDIVQTIKTLKPFNQIIKEKLLVDFTSIFDFDFSSFNVSRKLIVYGIKNDQNSQLDANLIAEAVKRCQLAIEASKHDFWNLFCTVWESKETEIEGIVNGNIEIHDIDELMAKYAQICDIMEFKWTLLDKDKSETLIRCLNDTFGWPQSNETVKLDCSDLKTIALLASFKTNSEFIKNEKIPVENSLFEQRKQSNDISSSAINDSLQAANALIQQLVTVVPATDIEAIKMSESSMNNIVKTTEMGSQPETNQEPLQNDAQNEGFIAESETQISQKLESALKAIDCSNSISLKVCSPEFQTLRQRIEKNLQKMFDFYSKRRLKPEPSKKEFDAYQASLKQMRLREFMDFCADFGVHLYTCPKKNSQGLQILFKLITTKTGLTFPKFINILRHVALKIKEEQYSQSLSKSNNAVQPDNTEELLTIDQENEQQRLPTCDSEDYFGKPEKQIASIELDDNAFESQEFAPKDSEARVPKESVKVQAQIPVVVHKCTAPALTTPEELEECFVGYMIALGIDNPGFCQQVTNLHKPREQRDESPANLRPLGSQELAELTFQPNISQSQPYDPAISKRLPKIQVRPQSGVREKSQLTQKEKLKVSNKNQRKSVKAPIPPHKDVYEKLYLQGVSKKGFQQHLKEINQKKESQTKIVQPPRKVSHPQVRTDSYAAKENFKKQAHFLQHINWEIVSKMSFSELAMQMQEKVGADNFNKLKKTVETTNKVMKGGPVIKIDSQEGKEEMPFQKHTKFLNYGKR